MKKLILLLFILFGVYANAAEYVCGKTNLPRLGTYSKLIMPDEYHMQFEINFEDSDFILERRENIDKIWFKGEGLRGSSKIWPDGDWLVSWMDYGTKPDIPTSAFHVLLPKGKYVVKAEYDTSGTHLFASNFRTTYTPSVRGNDDYIKDRSFILELTGVWVYSYPCILDECWYRPFVYDSTTKNLWMYKKLSIKLTLKDTTIVRDAVGAKYTIFLREFQLVNPYDAERFYPEEFTGIETLGAGKESYLRIRSKNEIEGSVSEITQKAYIEIRNGLGQHVRSVAVSERGKFSINLGSENVSPGFYLCTLVADGKRIDTTKIIIQP
jgi:hypothetical protein